METASKQLPNVLARLNEYAEQRESRSEERAFTAWAALAQMYGAKLTNDYGMTPPRVWVETITRLTDDELRRGFQRLTENGSEWPPSLPAFVSACRASKDGVRFLGTPTNPSQLRKLEPPRSQIPRVDVIDDWLHLMRENVAKAQIKIETKYRR